MPTENYFQVFKCAIARIYNKQGKVVGAGFLLTQYHLLTCAHVITAALGIVTNTQDSPTETIEVDFPLIAPGQKVKANVAFWQPVNPGQSKEDIAGLQIDDTLPTGVSPVKLVTTSDYWQHKFRIFGFPQGHDTGVWADGELRDIQATRWIQIEAIKVPGYQIEPGFSGSPVWDESLQGVVGMAVAAEKKREGVKAAFMMPTTVLVETWSFLSLIQVLTANLDTATIQTAYKYYGKDHDLVNSHQTTVADIVKDLYDVDKRNLDSNIKFNHNDNTAKFIKYLITNSQIHQTKLENLKKWGSNNIEDFDKLIQDVNQQYQNTDTKPESYILIKIEPLTTKSRSKIPKFKISGGVIPNIQNYIEHQIGFHPINFSDSPDDSFTLDNIEKVFCSLFQKIPCKLESQIKFVFFLPSQYLNHPVETWKIDNVGEIIAVGDRYPVIVRDVTRLDTNYLKVKQSNWIDKWQQLENITCNDFQKLHEYNETRFSVLMKQAIGVILN
ncbi:MAG: trypsin-like peptidase domain-containing protein, partial [Dolichospermum sp.]